MLKPSRSARGNRRVFAISIDRRFISPRRPWTQENLGTVVRIAIPGIFRDTDREIVEKPPVIEIHPDGSDGTEPGCRKRDELAYPIAVFWRSLSFEHWPWKFINNET
jgi:hypothetical protein